MGPRQLLKTGGKTLIQSSSRRGSTSRCPHPYLIGCNRTPSLIIGMYMLETTFIPINSEKCCQSSRTAMTFDLSFYRTKSTQEPKVEDLREFFRALPNFRMRDIDVEQLQKSLAEKGASRLEGKEAYDIDYENQSTGVYYQMFYTPTNSSN